KAACAIAAALPLGLAAAAVLRAFSTGLLTLGERALPFALAIALAVPSSLTPTAADERTPMMADLASAVRILHAEHRRDVPRIVRGLKAPEGMLALEGVHQLNDGPDQTAPTAGEGTGTALLLRVDDDDIPQSLPANWTIVRRDRGGAWVLVTVRSRIDW